MNLAEFAHFVEVAKFWPSSGVWWTSDKRFVFALKAHCGANTFEDVIRPLDIVTPRSRLCWIDHRKATEMALISHWSLCHSHKKNHIPLCIFLSSSYGTYSFFMAISFALLLCPTIADLELNQWVSARDVVSSLQVAMGLVHYGKLKRHWLVCSFFHISFLLSFSREEEQEERELVKGEGKGF